MQEIELLDIADDLLVINKTTIERLFQHKDHNVLILYLFYYKTAKWQKNNPIKANDEYCKKCLHWGIDKIQNTKKALKELQLIETIRRTDEKGVVIGWYIKVHYLIDESRIPETTIPTLPQLVGQETNTINNNNINTNNNRNTYRKYGNYKRIKLTDDEYKRLIEDYGENFIKEQIEKLDEYIESNNNKNKYTNFNLVLRKSIREKWFEKKETRYEREKRLLEEMLKDE